MRIGANAYEPQVDLIAEEKTRKRRKREAQEENTRWLHTLFLGFGVTVKLTALLMIFVTLVIHGYKFEEEALTDLDKGKLDGPGTELAVVLFVLCGVSLLVLTSNAVGPCSMKRRWNFALQCFGLLIDGSTAVVVKRVHDLWPTGAVEWSPTKWFNISAILLLSSSAVLLYSSYWINGTGWMPPKPKKLRYLRTTVTHNGEVTVGDSDNPEGPLEEEELSLL